MEKAADIMTCGRNRCERAAPRGNAVAALPYFGAALLRVVKNHPQGVPLSTDHTANPVPEIDAINPPRSLHGPVANRKDNRIALLGRNDFRPELNPRPRLGHQE